MKKLVANGVAVIDSPARDRLCGAEQIADFIGDPLPRTYRRLRRGIDGTWKEAGIWIGSRRAILAAHDRAAGLAA